MLFFAHFFNHSLVGLVQKLSESLFSNIPTDIFPVVRERFIIIAFFWFLYFLTLSGLFYYLWDQVSNSRGSWVWLLDDFYYFFLKFSLLINLSGHIRKKRIIHLIVYALPHGRWVVVIEKIHQVSRLWKSHEGQVFVLKVLSIRLW